MVDVASLGELREEKLTRENNELRADAERYRWLRNYRPGLILDMLDDHEIPNEQWASDLDKTIDSRMTAPNASNEGPAL